MTTQKIIMEKQKGIKTDLEIIQQGEHLNKEELNTIWEYLNQGLTEKNIKLKGGLSEK